MFKSKVTAAFFMLFALLYLVLPVSAQISKQTFAYTLSMAQPEKHTFQVMLSTSGWQKDTLVFKMPKWMPGYYQIMNYAQDVENFKAKDKKGNPLAVVKMNENSWKVIGTRRKNIVVSYEIKTTKQFVANSYLDADHAYIIGGNNFMYVDGFLHTTVTVKIALNHPSDQIATGLDKVTSTPHTFSAPNFDILYDCPILIGKLQELPSFKVKNIEHRFIGYKMGSFNKTIFMQNLQKIVEASSNIIGDIPYQSYSFIGIGPGRGGIEHLNNTTVSFDGNGLDNPNAMNQVMNFLAHEYFHHYNVKRIRPFELGPFDYDKGSKTNLLWISEGLTVYYEYLAVKRAGLVDKKTLFEDFESNINALENNEGRHYQSLAQASYNTWKDGPFGTQGEEAGKTISYYDKGPVVGLLLDFAIRNATQNEKSLDDVMRYLYWQYYKKLARGFTDAEFQAACEQIAGISLMHFFEYVYGTKELDYQKYLAFAGLQVSITETNGKRKYKLKSLANLAPLQEKILNSWLGE
jgi:predicted metalloprotease with PDZ domain